MAALALVAGTGCGLLFPLRPGGEGPDAGLPDAGHEAGHGLDAGDELDAGPDTGPEGGVGSCTLVTASTFELNGLHAVTAAYAYNRALVGTNDSIELPAGSEIWVIGGDADEPRWLWDENLVGDVASGIETTTDRVFVANDSGEVEVFAFNGQHRCNLEVPGATDVAVSGSHLFTVASTGRTWRHSLLGGEPCDAEWIDGPTLSCDARAVVAAGNRLAVACGLEGTVALVDSGDSGLTQAGEVIVGGTPAGLTIFGSLALVAADEAGLAAVDLEAGALAASDLTTACGAGLPAAAVAMHGSRAIVVAYSVGLYPQPASLVVVDVSDLDNPRCAGGEQLEAPAWDVAVSGDHAYVAADAAGLVVLEIHCY